MSTSSFILKFKQPLSFCYFFIYTSYIVQDFHHKFITNLNNLSITMFIYINWCYEQDYWFMTQQDIRTSMTLWFIVQSFRHNFLNINIKFQHKVGSGLCIFHVSDLNGSYMRGIPDIKSYLFLDLTI